ncbi:MAG: ankyrin repeat domain-containing protein [Candidatus Acidiferrum sp.]
MSATEFFEALRAGDVDAINFHLDSDPSLASAQNQSGISAVLMCVYTSRRDICDLLLARGAVLQLYDAAAVGDLGRVKEFVEHDPRFVSSFSPDGFPVFALAAVFGHLDIVRYLAQSGADIDGTATNGSGYNALTGAVASGHIDIVYLLLQRGANPNHRYGLGYSPLLTAAANGHLEIVKLLLAHGADPHAVSDDGKSALALADERNHAAVAEFLRNHLAASRQS